MLSPVPLSESMVAVTLNNSNEVWHVISRGDIRNIDTTETGEEPGARGTETLCRLVNMHRTFDRVVRVGGEIVGTTPYRAQVIAWVPTVDLLVAAQEMRSRATKRQKN